MNEQLLSTMEIDAIGEILNISLGASATAISTMLDARVDITTPVVNITKKSDFSFDEIKPTVAVEINYIKGLAGKNVMLLKKNDVQVIVEMLMGTTFEEDQFELNELNISAICEVMNQMMGSSATALSELFNTTVDISPPQSFEVENDDHFKDIYLPDDEPTVVIRFTLKIADKLESEFINLMSIDLAKELVGGFLQNMSGESLQNENINEEKSQPQEKSESEEKQQFVDIQSSQKQPIMQNQTSDSIIHDSQDTTMQQTQDSQPYTQSNLDNIQTTQTVPMSSGMEAGVMNQMIQTMQLMQQQMLQMQAEQEQKRLSVKRVGVSPIKSDKSVDEPDVNLDLLMSVPLELSVEIGRTKKLVKDILDLNKGTLVVLDKVAGEPVDLYVNGECIARGDVVVVDDNFGIRITEIIKEDLSTDLTGE